MLFSLPRLPFLIRYLFYFALFASSIDARTTNFDPTDAKIVYSPQDGWETGGGNSSMRSLKVGATAQIKFAGEQITLYGSTSSSSVSITLDDDSIDLDSTYSPSASASPSKLFQINNLDENGEHTLQLTVESEKTLVLSRIAIAFSSTNNNVPVLLPISSISTSSTVSATSTVPRQSAASNDPVSSSTSSSAGVAIGATIGALVAFSLFVLLAFYLYRRHRSPSRSPSSSRDLSSSHRNDKGHYMNQETGTRRGSFLLSAFQNRRASSNLLPWNSTPRTPLPTSPIDFGNDKTFVNGGIGSSPRGPLPAVPSSNSATSPVVIVGSETWQTRLARAASWRRKTERLAETRKFYGVGGRNAVAVGVDFRGPPPAVPLPRPPEARMRGDGVREMEERWRVAEGSLDVQGRTTEGGGPSPPLSISPYLIATPGDSNEEGGGGEIDENRFEQAWGQAISTNEDDHSSIAVASPTSTVHQDDVISHQHARRRSGSRALPFSPTESEEGAFTSSSSSRPYYQNPFRLTRTLTNTTSHSHSVDDSVRSSIENARISQAQARPIRGIGTSLPNSSLPLRGISSMASIEQGTVRAGPKGDTSVGLVAEREVMVERKPSLTRIHNGKVVNEPRGRYKSQAAIIVGEEAKVVGGGGERAATTRKRGEPELPSEEDRPDYFLKREVIPKYSQEAGDPRLSKSTR